MGAHMYDYEVGELLAAIREKFHTTNEDKNLTEADKKQLKGFLSAKHDCTSGAKAFGEPLSQ